MVSDRLGVAGDQQMKCCNNDCNQGRDCPYKQPTASTSELVITAILIGIAVGSIISFISWIFS